MKKVVIISFLFTSVMAVTAQKTVKAPEKSKTATALVLKNLLDSFSYAAGVNVGTSMKGQGILDLNTAIMQIALEDVFKNNTLAMTSEVSSSCLQKQLGIFSKVKADAESAKGKSFLEENKKNKDVVTLPSGLQYMILKKNDSLTNKPKATDTVVVNYIGTLIDGKEFDNSYKKGQAIVYPANGFIKGWTEALQLMKVGDKWKLFVPGELGYGPGGMGNGRIPPNATLIFEISLEGIIPAVPKEGN